MRRPIILAAAVLLACCGRHEDAALDTVATWNGGAVALAAVEEAVAESRTPACVKTRRAAGGGSLDELVPCYREAAEALVLEALVLAEVDVDAAVAAFVESEPQLTRHVYLETWLGRVREEIEIDDAEVAAYYETHRERYRRPAQRTVSNIFRRHQEPSRREETMAFLRQLKARYEAGETFAALAREHSHSETRLRGGLVGRLSEGRLPKRLEQIAFGLGEGEISDPIAVRGGGVLLHTTGVVEGAEFSLDEVRDSVRRQLRAEKVSERRRRRVAAAEVPEGSLVLATDELLAVLDQAFPPGDDEGAAERPVLVIGDQILTAGEMRQLAGLTPEVRAAEADEESRRRMVEIYEGQRELLLLVADLVASTDAADAELRREAEEQLRRDAVAGIVDERLREGMWRLVDADPEKLRGFYEDNRPHYQSPLRFKLHLWTVPFGADPPRQLKRMEELEGALAAGAADLEVAAAELGGSVRSLGWRELRELAGDMPRKARDYLLQTEAGGFSVPFQQDQSLHLLWVEERREPRPQSYEEVTERVRDDYFERFEQQLYRQVVDERLATAGFRFREDAVRRLLAPEGS